MKFALILLIRFNAGVSSVLVSNQYPDLETCRLAAEATLVEFRGMRPVPSDSITGTIGYACAPIQPNPK